MKAILETLGVEYPSTHGWNREQVAKIAGQLRHRQLLERLEEQHLDHSVHLPRLLFLVNFWSHFYLLAKYGFEAANLAPAQELFGKNEAELALRHAEECHRAATTLRYLPEEKLSGLISQSNPG